MTTSPERKDMAFHDSNSDSEEEDSEDEDDDHDSDPDSDDDVRPRHKSDPNRTREVLDAIFTKPNRKQAAAIQRLMGRLRRQAKYAIPLSLPTQQVTLTPEQCQVLDQGGELDTTTTTTTTANDETGTCRMDLESTVPTTPPKESVAKQSKLKKRRSSPKAEAPTTKRLGNKLDPNLRMIGDDIQTIIGALEKEIAQTGNRDQEGVLSLCSIRDYLADLHCYSSHYLGTNPGKARWIRNQLRMAGGAKLVSLIMTKTLEEYYDQQEKDDDTSNQVALIQAFGCMVLQDLAYDSGKEQHVVLAGGMDAPLRALQSFSHNEYLTERAFELVLNLLIGESSDCESNCRWFWACCRNEAPAIKHNDDSATKPSSRPLPKPLGDYLYLQILLQNIQDFPQILKLQDLGCGILFKLITMGSDRVDHERIVQHGGLVLLAQAEQFCQATSSTTSQYQAEQSKEILKETRQAISTLITSLGWNNSATAAK